MQNDPKWPQQTWMLPYEAGTRLERENDRWSITLFAGAVRVPIRAEDGERLAAGLAEFYQEQGRKDLEERRRQSQGPNAGDIINSAYRI